MSDKLETLRYISDHLCLFLENKIIEFLKEKDVEYLSFISVDTDSFMPRYLVVGDYTKSPNEFYEYNVVAIGVNDDNLVAIVDSNDAKRVSKDLYGFLAKKCEIKSLSEIENKNLSLEIKNLSCDIKQTASCLEDTLCSIIDAICEIYQE